jgi:hypothetical protein
VLGSHASTERVYIHGVPGQNVINEAKQSKAKQHCRLGSSFIPSFFSIILCPLLVALLNFWVFACVSRCEAAVHTGQRKRLFLKIYAYWLMVGALDLAGGCALRIARWLAGMNDCFFWRWREGYEWVVMRVESCVLEYARQSRAKQSNEM